MILLAALAHLRIVTAHDEAGEKIRQAVDQELKGKVTWVDTPKKKTPILWLAVEKSQCGFSLASYHHGKLNVASLESASDEKVKLVAREFLSDLSAKSRRSSP